MKILIILFLLIFSFFIKREIYLTKATTKTKLMVLLMGIMEAAAVAVVNFGLISGDAILITPIASALSVVTITMAIVFLKEKITIFQGIGIIITIFGIIVTAF
ncbi:MAG: EamA family transporter [Deltaproteobacteria bacterium]|nr:EamA family transporter [Deltaproteobacteria bacterium]